MLYTKTVEANCINSDSSEITVYVTRDGLFYLVTFFFFFVQEESEGKNNLNHGRKSPAQVETLFKGCKQEAS